MTDEQNAVAAERRRIAKLLHDGPVQELTATQLFLESALGEQPAIGENAMMQRATHALERAITSCRALMGELAGGDDDDP